MRTTFFFHKMKSNRRLQQYASRKINEKIEKFVTKVVDVRIGFEHEAAEYKLTCHVVGGDGFAFHIKAKCEDPYGSVDLLLDKLERVLRKHKGRVKDHRGIVPKKRLSWQMGIDAFADSDYPEYKDIKLDEMRYDSVSF